jgi:hypothetical protein
MAAPAAGKDATDMVPKALSEAGYTAVGLGVLVLQQVQTQRRAVGRRASAVAVEVTKRLDGLRSRLS